MLSQTRRPNTSLWTSPSHFFTGSLVCTDPPLVLATGSAVDVLERDWQNYFVMLDLNNVAPYGRLPSVFSTIACVHGISKSYPIHTFGETSWIVIELDPLRSHIPTRAPRAHGKIRTRTRSNSLPPSPSTPPDDSSNFPLSSSPNSSAQPPDMHPSHSVCFDINQASSTPVMPSSTIPHPWRASDGHVRSISNNSNASYFFRQAPTRPIHSLVRARLQCIFATKSRFRSGLPPYFITVRLYFGSNPQTPRPTRVANASTVAPFHSTDSTSTEEAPWKLEEGLLVAINDGKPCPSDSWVLGAGGKPYLQSDREYVFTLANGLAGDGIMNEDDTPCPYYGYPSSTYAPPITFRKLRLVRRFGKKWTDQDFKAISPQAYIEITDSTDDRIKVDFGPVMFERDGVDGSEWVGDVPNVVMC